MRIDLRTAVAVALFALAATVAEGAEINVSDATSLTAALATAESNDEDNVITLAAGVYEGHFEYVSKAARSLTIRAADGAAQYSVVLDGASTGRILNISVGPSGGPQPYTIEIRGIVLKDGDSSTEGHREGGGLRMGVSSGAVRIVDCVIRDCIGQGYGGGIYVYNSTDIRVERCMFLNNEVASLNADPGRGGGLALWPPGGTHAVTGCLFSRNIAEVEGGGLWVGFANAGTRNIVSNTIYQNQAPFGAGIYFYAAHTANVMNNILWENTPTKAGDIMFRDGFVTNRVGYHNNFGSVVGDWTDEDGNRNVDPEFVAPGNLDLRLQAGSPLIDQGRNDAPGMIVHDLAGEARFYDGDRDGEPTVDIGAYEYIRIPRGTIGSEVVLAGVGFGEKKPKVYLLYEKKPGKMKAAKFKVLEYSDGRLKCLFKKKVPAGTYDVFCQPKVKGADPIPLGSYMVEKPGIGPADPEPATPGTLVELAGDYFGTKKPKVFLVDPGTGKRRKARVKSVIMHPETGASDLEFIVPKLPPLKYVLIVEAAIGEAESSYVVAD
jgi:hypothetical protein